MALIAFALPGCCRSRKRGPPPGPVEWVADRLPTSDDKIVINAIGGTGPDDVWAVGWGIFHWDGLAWTRVDPPELRGYGTALNALSVVARDNVWAVGVNGRVAHFDGTTWHGEQIDVAAVSTDPANRSYYDLLGVAAWPDGVWVTASKTGHYYYDTTTKRWTVVPDSELGNRTQQQVWGIDPRDVWLAGPAHFDGTGWDQSTVHPAAGLREVHGSARDDVWQVGWLGGNHKDDIGAAYHYDGRLWSQSPLPEGTPLLWDVYAASRTEAYAVGGHGWTVVWNGSSWRASAAGVQGELRAVYSPGGGVAFAGGDIGPVVLRHK